MVKFDSYEEARWFEYQHWVIAILIVIVLAWAFWAFFSSHQVNCWACGFLQR